MSKENWVITRDDVWEFAECSYWRNDSRIRENVPEDGLPIRDLLDLGKVPDATIPDRIWILIHMLDEGELRCLAKLIRFRNPEIFLPRWMEDQDVSTESAYFLRTRTLVCDIINEACGESIFGYVRTGSPKSSYKIFGIFRDFFRREEVE